MANNIANLGVQVSMDLDPLKQSTSTLKSMLTSNNKALKNHERAFKGSSMGAQDLADREKVLSKQIETSAQYVEKKKNELDNLKSSIGNVNEATDKQKQQLLNANSALSTAQHELSGYKNQLSGVQSQQANMSRSTTDLQSELRDLQLETKMTASEQRKSGDAMGALETEYKGLGRQTQLYNTIIAKEKDKLAELRSSKGDDARETQNQERNVSKLMKEQGSLVTQQDKVKDSIDNMNDSSKNTGRGFNDMWAVFKGSFLAQGVMSIISKVSSGLKNMFGGAIERMDAISSNTKSLTLLLGDSTKAAKVMDDALESIEGTSIPLDSVAESVKKLISSGVDAKDLKYTLKGITDSAFGLGKGEESISGITDALVSMNTAGTANLGDIRRLEDNGVQALKILANQYDMSIEEMKKSLSSGELKSSEITKKLIDGIEKGTDGVAGQTKALKGMAQTSAETVGGSFKNFMTGIKASITTILQPVEGDIISMFNNMTKGFKDTAGTFAKTLAPMLKGAVEWFKNLNPNVKTGALVFTALGIAGTAAAIGVGALTAVLGAILSPATLVVGAITAIGTGLVMAYMKSEKFRDIVNGAFKSVANAVKPAIQAVKGFFQLFKGNGQDGIITLSKIFPPDLVVGISNTVDVIKRTIMQVFSAVGKFGQQIGSYLRNFWDENGAMIKEAIGNIGTAIKFVMEKIIWPIMKFIWPAVKYLIVSTWDAIKGTISGALQIITGVIKVFSALFTANWKALWAGIKQIAKGAFQFLFNAIQLWFVGKIFGVGKLFAKLFGGRLSAMWKSISGFFTKYASLIWKTTSKYFTNIYKSVKGIFTSTKNFISSTWNFIFKTLSNIVLKIYKGVTSRFTSLSNKVKSTVKSLRDSIVSRFNNVRKMMTDITEKARAIVTGKFGNLANKVKSTILGLRNNVVDRFTNFKNRVIAIGETIRSTVVGKFKGLYDGAVSWIGKIKQFIIDAKDGFKKVAKDLGNSIANGAINGLNAMIDGVNWLSKKIMDKELIKNKIQPLHTGTGGSNGVRTNSKGQLQENTLAMVNDKGRGNGKGPNGHQEIIRDKDGSMYAPQGRNVVLPLSKGMEVINGRNTQAMVDNGLIPKFSAGSGTKSRKKKPTAFEQGLGVVKAVTKAGTNATVKTVSKKGGEIAGKSTAKAFEVWDYVENPGKLVQIALDKFGVDFSKIKATYGEFMKHGYAGLKKGLVSKVMSWFEDAGGYGDVDGSSILKHGISFGYSPNKPLPGYPLSINGGRHYGIDTPHVYEKIQAPTGGIVRQQSDVGGGKIAQILNGKLAQYYLHLSDVIKTGRIKKGETFAKTGNSGAYTTGAHLHTQIEDPASNALTNKNTKDPEKFLKSKGGKTTGGGNWISTVRAALKVAGLPQTKAYVNAWLKQIQTESSGNPNAIGGTDGYSHGRATGLVQVKPTTFQAMKGKGMNDIKNPLHNLVAGMNWAKHAYGSSILGVIGKGHGYAKGTNFATKGFANVFEKGGEIINFRGGEQVIPNDVSISAIKSVIQSDIFNKTQSAVYSGISQYADALREKEQAKYQAQMQQQVDTQSLQEQNSILKEMLYTMQDLVVSSRNNEKYNKQTANKRSDMDWDKAENILSSRQGKRIQDDGYRSGGVFI